MKQYASYYSRRKGNGGKLTPTREALPDGDHANAVRRPFKRLPLG